MLSVSHTFYGPLTQPIQPTDFIRNQFLLTHNFCVKHVPPTALGRRPTTHSPLCERCVWWWIWEAFPTVIITGNWHTWDVYPSLSVSSVPLLQTTNHALIHLSVRGVEVVDSGGHSPSRHMTTGTLGRRSNKLLPLRP